MMNEVAIVFLGVHCCKWAHCDKTCGEAYGEVYDTTTNNNNSINSNSISSRQIGASVGA